MAQLRSERHFASFGLRASGYDCMCRGGHGLDMGGSKIHMQEELVCSIG
jgi:hypothetical protein